MEFPSHERDLPPIVMFNSSLRDLSSFTNICTYTWTCHAIPFEGIRNNLHYTTIFHLLCRWLDNVSPYEKNITIPIRTTNIFCHFDKNQYLF